MSDNNRSTLRNGMTNANDKLIKLRATTPPESTYRSTLLLLLQRNIQRFFEINFAKITNIEVESFANLWITAWLKSWIVAFPIVLIVAPLTQLFDGKLVVGATR